MRKQLCTIASLFITTVAGAQTEKGNGLISGSISVSTSWSTNKLANTSLHTWQPNLYLTAGHFVADNWLVGASALVQTVFTRSKRPSFTGQIDRPLNQQGDYVQVNFMPFARRYWQFAPVQVFAGLGLSVNTNDQRQRNDEIGGAVPQLNTVEQRTTSWTANPYLEAGANYFLTKRLALQVVASSTALPLNVAGFSTGLVYWTGADRKADPQEERTNNQTNRGNWTMEGFFSAGRSLSKYENLTIDTKQTSGTYIISPAIGYFIRKNTILGIRVPLQFGSNQSSGQNPRDNTEHYWSVGLSPYYQHYWTSTRLTPYTLVEATYGLFKQGSGDLSSQSGSASVGLGLAYMAGQRFIVQTSLASATLAFMPSNGSGDGIGLWSANLSAGLRGNFAVRYVLTRPK